MAGRARRRHGLAVRELNGKGGDAAAEAGCERALCPTDRSDRDQSVIDARVDDQRRIAVAGIAARERCQRGAHFPVPDFDPVAPMR